MPAKSVLVVVGLVSSARECLHSLHEYSQDTVVGFPQSKLSGGRWWEGERKRKGKGGAKAIYKEFLKSHLASIISHSFYQEQITKSGPHSTGREF